MTESIIYMPPVSDRAAILAGPDYFTCERTHCRIKKTECITRQGEGIPAGGITQRKGGRSTRLVVPPECWDCAQGVEIREELGGKGERVKGSEAERKTCDDKECQHYVADQCTYIGKMTAGLCKRKYMQKYYQERKTQSAEKPVDESVAAEVPETTDASVVAEAPVGMQIELDQTPEAAVQGPSVFLDFEGDDQLYEELKKAAEDELRTVRNQALWYIKQGVKHDSAG